MSSSISLTDNLNQYLSQSTTNSNQKGGNSSSNQSFFSWFDGKSSTNSTNSNWFYSKLSTRDDTDQLFFTEADVQSTGCLERCCNGFFNLFPTLSRTQRFVGFLMCLFFGAFCFVTATFYIPLLVFKARKFALLFTLGSCFVLSSFFFLNGPLNQLKSLLRQDRLPFTGGYLISLAATLYTSLWLQSTILTIIFAVIQVIALLWYLFDFIPGGSSGFKFFGRLVGKAATSTLPI